MDGAVEEGYKPPPDFQEDYKEPLVDINVTDSTELWLIQWPLNQPPDFDGQKILLELHHDGKLGTLEGSSGKVYDVVSFASQKPDATVFLSSTSESNIVGKISRRVSFVHYPEPGEYEDSKSKELKQMYPRSVSFATGSSSHLVTQSSKLRSPFSASGQTTSTHSSRRSSSKHRSRHKSALSGDGGPSKSPIKRYIPDADQSTQDSGRGVSAVTSSGSFGQSQGPSTVASESLEHSRSMGTVASSGSLVHCRGDSGVTSSGSLQHHRKGKSKKVKREG